jgi:hypothetical protein
MSEHDAHDATEHSILQPVSAPEGRATPKHEDDDDRFYRSQYEDAPDRLADRSYERVRPAYVVGHLAGRNPQYQGRTFEDVEGDLRCGWSDEVTAQCGQWPSVRGYARSAFERARGTPVRDDA